MSLFTFLDQRVRDLVCDFAHKTHHPSIAKWVGLLLWKYFGNFFNNWDQVKCTLGRQ